MYMAIRCIRYVLRGSPPSQIVYLVCTQKNIGTSNCVVYVCVYKHTHIHTCITASSFVYTAIIVCRYLYTFIRIT